MLRRTALLVFVALALAPVASAATKGPVFGIRGVGNNKLGYFVYPLSPGQSRTGAVIVSNTGDQAGTVKLYAVNGTTGRTTGTVYETSGPLTGTGTWVKLAASTLRLPAGTHAQVSFTVHVPAGASPGQWVAGLAAETAHKTPVIKTTHKASVQINVRNVTIIAVQVNVPGKQRVAFSIGNITTGGQRGFQQVFVHIANTGTLLRKPTGEVVIVKDGSVVETLPFKMDTFLPQTAIDYPLLLKKALGPGSYEARVLLSYPNAVGAARKITTTTPFKVSKQNVAQVFTSASPTKQPVGGTLASSGSSSTPWALIGGAAAVVVLLLLLLLWLLLRRRRKGAAPEEIALPVAALAATEPPPAPVPPEPVEPEPVPPAQATAAPATTQQSACHHYWEVAYERGELSRDGVWRFPHRCKNCSLEVLATSVEDASAQAAAHETAFSP